MTLSEQVKEELKLNGWLPGAGSPLADSRVQRSAACVAVAAYRALVDEGSYDLSPYTQFLRDFCDANEIPCVSQYTGKLLEVCWPVWHWNDEPDRTEEEIWAALDKTAELERIRRDVAR